MKTLTRNEALAGAMTAEEAGTATFMRALQIQGAAVALLSRGGSQISDWENTLKTWEQNRPWDLLPEDSEAPYGKWDLWTAATLKVNGDPLTRGRLVALLAGLHGETAKAEAQIQAFEKAIEQPLVLPNGRPKGSKNFDPDKSFSSSQGKRINGTSVGYLMGRLLKIDPNIQDRIGKGLEFASINAAAQALGVMPKRQRYELNPEVNTSNAAARIVDILGPAKAAELVTAITLQLTQSND
jgi:hypothetical protein